MRELTREEKVTIWRAQGKKCAQCGMALKLEEAAPGQQALFLAHPDCALGQIRTPRTYTFRRADDYNGDTLWDVYKDGANEPAHHVTVERQHPGIAVICSCKGYEMRTECWHAGVVERVTVDGYGSAFRLVAFKVEKVDGC